MRRSLWLVAAASVALAAAQPLHAQVLTVDLTLPPGTAIPNYDRIRIGQDEAMEGNAYVARTGDAGSS